MTDPDPDLALKSSTEPVTFDYSAVRCIPEELKVLKAAVALHETQGKVTWSLRKSLHTRLIVVGSRIRAGEVESFFKNRVGKLQVLLHLGKPTSPHPEARLLFSALPVRVQTLAGQLAEIERLLRALTPETGEMHPPKSLAQATLHLVAWPEPEILQGLERVFVRLLTLLFARNMTLSELAAASGESLAQCRAFAEEMDRMGLLARRKVVTCRKPVSPGD
ncbi:MAG: hypothetical protein LBR88_02730 [Zoogloeaceae bacterium]|jgi:hypothetical protein|nr:hypothetical protein [Zoogloeaceae bacterium]